MVIAFAPITISTNLARDLGTRMVAAAFLDTAAFTYKSYCWIGILVNVPATLFAVSYYELWFKDTQQHIEGGHLSHPSDVNLTSGDVKLPEDSTLSSTRLGRFLTNRSSVKESRPDFADHSSDV